MKVKKMFKVFSLIQNIYTLCRYQAFEQKRFHYIIIYKQLIYFCINLNHQKNGLKNVIIFKILKIFLSYPIVNTILISMAQMQNQNTNPPLFLSDVVAHMNIQQGVNTMNNKSTQIYRFQFDQQGFHKKLKIQDIESQRYHCYCERQYLSYTALYSHVRKKHPEYFIYNQGLANGNLIESYDPQYGFKIRKLVLQKVRDYPTQSKYTIGSANEVLYSPTQSGSQNFKPDYLLGKQEIRGMYELHYIKKLENRIFESKQIKELQDKWLKTYSQKLQKMQSIVGNLSQIAGYYQRILRIINIKQIVNTLDNPIYQVHSDDSSLE